MQIDLESYLIEKELRDNPKIKHNREDYKEYLKSSHWKKLKEEKGKSFPICQLCKKHPKKDIHHLRYKNKYDIEQKDLMSLCRGCHQTVHKINNKGFILYICDKYCIHLEAEDVVNILNLKRIIGYKKIENVPENIIKQILKISTVNPEKKEEIINDRSLLNDYPVQTKDEIIECLYKRIDLIEEKINHNNKCNEIIKPEDHKKLFDYLICYEKRIKEIKNSYPDDSFFEYNHPFLSKLSTDASRHPCMVPSWPLIEPLF